MKPTFDFSGKSRRDLGDSASRRFDRPQTDYSFQPASAVNSGRCFGGCRPSFLAISQGYFENEARTNFASEAALFVVMMMTAAAPIVYSLYALANLVRSFAPL